MSMSKSDFKTVGTMLIRNQRLISTPTNTDSEESTIMRHIDYGGDSNDLAQIRVDSGQRFEIVVDTLILSDRALKTVRGTYNKCIGVRMRWRFLGKDESSRIIQVRRNEIPVNEQYTYYIPNESAVTFFDDRVMHFDVYAIYATKEKYIGFSELQLSDCIENVNMQLGKCLDLLYVTGQKCCTPRKTKNIGRLLIQYKLYSQPIQNKAAALKEIIDTIQKLPQSSLSNTRCRTIEKSDVTRDSHHTVKLKKTSSLLERIITKVSEGVLPSSSQQKTDKLIDEQQSLLDYFTEDLIRGEKLANLKANPASLPNLSSAKFARLHHAAIQITINSLKFNEDFGKTLKPNMTYYVEYSFLTKEGLETLNFPLSEDYSTIYDAMTTFKLDMKNNMRECKIISKMIKNGRSLRFAVIEEPIVDYLKVPICIEVGYSDVSLRDLATGKNNNTEFTLLSMKHPHTPIGYLNIDILGLENIADILRRRSIYSLIYGKARSLGSIEDKPEGEIEETGALKKFPSTQDNIQYHTVVPKDFENASFKLRNMLKGRSSSVTFKITKKVTRGDVATSLKPHRKAHSLRRKKIERAKLNRRFTTLTSNHKLTIHNVADGHPIEAIDIVVEKSETENTKETLKEV